MKTQEQVYAQPGHCEICGEDLVHVATVLHSQQWECPCVHSTTETGITIDHINALTDVGGTLNGDVAPPGVHAPCYDNFWPEIRETEGVEQENGKYRIDDSTGWASPEYADTEEEAVTRALDWAEACHVVERQELERIYREGDRQAAWDLEVESGA